MTTLKQSKTLQILSGTLFVVYGALYLFCNLTEFQELLESLGYLFSHRNILAGLTTLADMVYPMFFISAGVVIITKKNNLSLRVLLSIAVAVDLFFLVKGIHYITSDHIYPPYSATILFRNIFLFLATETLVVMSSIHHVKPRSAALKLWFIPVALYFAAGIMQSLYRLNLHNDYGSAINFVWDIIFPLTYFILAAGSAFFGIMLASDKKSSSEYAEPFSYGQPIAYTPPVYNSVPQPAYSPNQHPTNAPQPAPFSNTTPSYEVSPTPESYSASTGINADFVASELRKCKAMLDEGLITEEDYNQKKNQLLNL